MQACRSERQPAAARDLGLGCPIAEIAVAQALARLRSCGCIIEAVWARHSYYVLRFGEARRGYPALAHFFRPPSARAGLLLRSDLCACPRGSPFGGRFFALIADKRRG
jgi:hypothetical protein